MKPIPKHLYNGDGVPDWRDEDRCTSCKQKKGHANHNLPPAPPEQAHHRERYGETE